MAIKHAFVSAKSDGGDATQLQPSNWNADHLLTGGLAMDETAPDVPANYSNAGSTLYSKMVARRGLPAVRSFGWDSVMQPSIFGNQVSAWLPPGNGTGVPGVFGLTALTAVGTATTRSVATTNFLTRQRRLGYVSAGTAGALAGHYQTVRQTSTSGGQSAGFTGFFYACRFAFTDAAAVSGARAFVGLAASTSAPTNVDPATLTNCIGIAQLDSDATQLYLYHNGPSGTPGAIPLGTNFPPMDGTGAANGTLYDLYIASHPLVAYSYYVQLVNLLGGFTYTASGESTYIPDSSNFIGHRAWRCNNATALAVGIDVCSVYIENP